MRKIGFLSIVCIALATMSVTHCTFSTEDETEMSGKLEIGEAAPLFSLPGSDGRTYRLEDFIGNKAVVIAWFPKAFTGG